MMSLRSWLMVALFSVLISMAVLIIGFCVGAQLISVKTRMDTQAAELHSMMQFAIDEAGSLNTNHLKNMVDQHFLTGRYRSIHLSGEADFHHQLDLHQRLNTGAPAWFISAIEFDGYYQESVLWLPQPSDAALTLKVMVNPAYDYLDIWQQSKRLSVVAMVLIVIFMGCAFMGLRRLTSSLGRLSSELHQLQDYDGEINHQNDQILEINHLFGLVYSVHLKFQTLLLRHHSAIKAAREAVLLDSVSGFWHMNRFKNLVRFSLEQPQCKSMGTLVLFKLRGFESINEHLGYDQADDCLRQVANIFSQCW